MSGAGDNGWTRRSLLGAGLASAVTLIAAPAIARPLRKPPVRQLFIQNQNTGEIFRGPYWEKGRYISSAVRHLDRVLRDHRANETIEMDRSLYDLLYGIQSRINPRRPMFITSAYRSLLTNAALQAEGYHPAENSLHLVGKAADIHFERVRLIDMRKAAMSLRAGGVGTYPSSNFLHVDTGRVRFW
jgi:uncharacterized protein YcbK (DUF882 family)